MKRRISPASLKQWSEILTIISGKNQKNVKSDTGQYPIYGSGGIIGYATEYLCEAGTTIVGRKGTIDKPIFVNERFWNVDTAFGISPSDVLDAKYLYYFCRQFNFKKLDKSTTIPSLAKRDLLQIKMPVPPIMEQRRIVSRIEELFSKLDKGVETLQTIKQQLAVYRQAVLKEAFARIEEKRTIREMSVMVTSGSRGWAKYYADNGALFIRIGNLGHVGISICFDDVQCVDLPDKAEGIRSRLYKNDVLVSITADLGSIGYVPENIPEAYINQHIAMIRFKNPIQGKFMAWYLRSEYGQKDLLKNKRGGGKQGLGLDDIRNTRVPNVSNEYAEKIVQEIESRLSVCDSIEQTVAEALIQADAMRQSILKQAFEGEI